MPGTLTNAQPETVIRTLRVSWEIDIEADSAEAAAFQALLDHAG